MLLPLGVLLLFCSNPDATFRGAVWPACIPLAAALALTFGTLFLIRDPDPTGGGVAGATSALSSVGKIASNSVAFAIHWVVALPLAIPWVLIRANALSATWALTFAAVTGAAAVLLAIAHGAVAPGGVALIAGIGLAVVVDVFIDGWRRHDRIQLALGAWLLAAVPVLVYAHFPSKYLLASAPAAAILVARRSDAFGLARVRGIVAAVACSGVLLGVAILRADAKFGGLSRAAARELIAPATASGERVWYLGRWGFQWYAEEAGARALHPTSRPAPGDLIVSSENSKPGPLASFVRRFPEVGRMEERRPGGRIMSHLAGAGFYSNSWGYLPWAWGEEPVDVVAMRRVAE
jgi:hypothetical protein